MSCCSSWEGAGRSHSGEEAKVGEEKFAWRPKRVFFWWSSWPPHSANPIPRMNSKNLICSPINRGEMIAFWVFLR